MPDTETIDFSKADIFLNDAIQTIAQSPFGKTHKGHKIVHALNICRKNKKISFEKQPDGTRGSEQLGKISISSDYYSNKPATILELVHEGTHALDLFHRNPNFRYDRPEKIKPQSSDDSARDEKRRRQTNWKSIAG